MRDPERDPRLAAALREAAGEPPFGEEDAARLRGSIAAAAELPLTRLRGGRRRRRWLRVALPAAAAAGLGALLVLGTDRPSSEGRLTAEEQAVIDAIVEASLPPRVDLAISGELQDEALLDAAVGS